MIVWDHGTWEPHGTGDAAAAVAVGELHADVHGHKLRGRLVLERCGRDRSGTDQWLLVHKRDQYSVEGWDPADYPRSVLSGRTSEEVKADPRRGVAPGPAACVGQRAGRWHCRGRPPVR